MPVRRRIWIWVAQQLAEYGLTDAQLSANKDTSKHLARLMAELCEEAKRADAMLDATYKNIRDGLTVIGRPE